MNRPSVALTGALVILALADGLAGPAVAATPSPDQSTWDDLVGVSPKNVTVSETYRYVFRGTLRTAQGEPIPGFPASQIELDFSSCLEPSTRPSDQIPADGPSGEHGDVVWSVNLNFGSADPCEVRVLVQNVVFKRLAMHQGLPDPMIDGGVRSPDENGDGVVSLADFTRFQVEFSNTGSRRDYIGDLAQPFDGMTTVRDLVWFQKHLTAPNR